MDTAWVRNSSSTLLGSQDNTTNLANVPAITLESFSQNSAVASGYYLFVRSTASGIPVNRFVPADTARLAISLYLNDTTTVTTSTLSPLEEGKLAVFPNPTTGKIRFQFVGSLASRPSVEIFDLQGRRIRTTQMIPSAMSLEASVDISEYPDGAYIYRLIHSDAVYSGKFIKASTH